MGSTFIKSLMVLLLVSVSCQDQDSRLDFRVGSKLKKEYKAKLLDGSVELSVSGGVGGLGPHNRYLIGLGITVRYEGLQDSLCFDPHSIRAYISNTEMEKFEPFIRVGYPSIALGYYYVSVSFVGPPMPDGALSILTDDHFKIVLAGFIRHGDSLLQTDTIVALAPSRPSRLIIGS